MCYRPVPGFVYGKGGGGVFYSKNSNKVIYIVESLWPVLLWYYYNGCTM